MARDGLFTETERKIIELLADGRAHTKDEMRECLRTSDGSDKVIMFHVCRLRRLLRPRGEEIVCVGSNRKRLFQHVRLISWAE